jgi:hypothetical protein
MQYAGFAKERSAQSEHLALHFPDQDNRRFRLERGLPKRFGRWHTIYMRMNRWAKSSVLDRVFERPQFEQIVRIRIEAQSLDSTSVKIHPDGTGALKNRPQAMGIFRGGWNTKIPMVATDARTAIVFALSPGHDHDAPHGRALLEQLGPMPEGLPMVMNRAYEDNETRRWCSI